MNQTFYFTARMTHAFLRYAESVHLGNQKVLLLIDNLRKGLTEEEMLLEQGYTEKLKLSIRKNVRTCGCIMLHVQCLGDLAENHEPYDRFLNGWSKITANTTIH